MNNSGLDQTKTKTYLNAAPKTQTTTKNTDGAEGFLPRKTAQSSFIS